jgi:hypothetical protein
MIDLPDESDIDSMGQIEAQRLAVTFLLDPTAAATLGDLKTLLRTVRRALDPDIADQDLITFEEVTVLYDHLALDPTLVDNTSEDALDWLLPILNFYAANLP